jgi:DNA-binding response OmpR family regulator
MSARILIVEDDTPMSIVLRENLTFEGFDAKCAPNAHLAIAVAKEFGPDLIILDLNLPDASGFDLCDVLRRKGATPIIMLTARCQKVDKLRGLNCGADDYITKPFDLEELLARIRAVLRRATATVETLTLGSVTIDFRAQIATKGGQSLSLTAREFELIHYLAEREPHIVYRDELLRAVWGYPEMPTTRSVDNAILRIRKKIEYDPHHPTFIHTHRGDGYILNSGRGGTHARPEM